MKAFAKGTPVTQIVKPIEGVVVGFDVDQETGDRLIKVEWTEEDGSTASKFFKDDELEVKA